MKSTWMMILNLVVTLLCLVLKSNGNDDGKEGNYISGVTILLHQRDHMHLKININWLQHSLYDIGGSLQVRTM